MWVSFQLYVPASISTNLLKNPCSTVIYKATRLENTFRLKILLLLTSARSASGSISMYQVPQTATPSGTVDKSFFISGSVHQPYTLGERVTLEEITELDQRIPQSAGKRSMQKRSRRSGPITNAVDSSKTTGRPAISLQQLVEKGILKPGPDQISCSYKGQTIVANLADDGFIEYEGHRYQSATSFSITFKRTITPSKQGDDGWKSVIYEGKPLEHYRKLFLLHAGGDEELQESRDVQDSMHNAEVSSQSEAVEDV